MDHKTPTTIQVTGISGSVPYLLGLTLSVCLVAHIWFVNGKRRIACESDTSIRVQPEAAPGSEHFPLKWWTDPAHFQLERRALFSTMWICVSHRSSFVTPGDYKSYEYAGFRYFLILDKSKTMRAFHNVCRHRAFPVAQKAAGSATVLGCKYHGWSYDTGGKLIKAPKFEDVSGFDKSKNGLFEIHCRVDGQGFVHLNFSREEGAGDGKPPVAERIGSPGMISSTSSLIHSQEHKAKFNWKLAVNDNFQRGCQRLPTISDDPDEASKRPKAGQILFSPLSKAYTRANDPVWYHITYIPISAKQTTLRCDVYSSNKAISTIGTPIKERLNGHLRLSIEMNEQVFKDVTNFDQELKMPEAFINKTMKSLRAHSDRERTNGWEIHPASVAQCSEKSSAGTQGLCQKLEQNDQSLEW